jgi:alpha-ketoglutarate-dependent taurine dioxygenase
VDSRGGGPVLLSPDVGADAREWLAANVETIDRVLLQYGGVVLRDMGCDSVSEFNHIAQTLCPTLVDYINRSTPRTKLGGKLYTATEYPAERTIPLHNESSYADVWPSRILFYCAVAARSGGETPVADSRRVYQAIDPTVRARFERAGVAYVRNYTAGIDLSWQEVFQTTDRSEVDRYCADHGIDAVWRDGRTELTTVQRRPSTMAHPRTRESVWFNQAHLFHASALHADEREALVAELGAENLPRDARFGDGEAIDLDMLAHVREVYEQEKVTFQWHRGDVMVLDNVLCAHARNPFSGPRKIVVAMG